MNILETKRLVLREMTVEDAVHAYELNLDPEVIRYTGDAAFTSIEEARNFLKNYDHYEKYGFGRWGVINKADGDFLGWCGLKYIADINEYDIGFRFFKKHWNKGYATESAQACIDIGFSRYGMTTIVGRAMKDNIGSIRVLEKVGLTFDRAFNFDDHFSDHEGVIYKIEKHNSK